MSFFLSFHSKQGNNATKMQVATGSEREGKDFRRNQKSNPTQGIGFMPLSKIPV